MQICERRSSSSMLTSKKNLIRQWLRSRSEDQAAGTTQNHVAKPMYVYRELMSIVSSMLIDFEITSHNLGGFSELMSYLLFRLPFN